MIQIENLVKRYGNVVALDHLNLTVKEGEIFGLLGPNGSGKTTAIGCILALLKYDKGMVKVMGEEMFPNSYHLKRQIGVVPQNLAYFDELTVYENVDYFCGLYVKSKKERKKLVEEAIDFVNLSDYAKVRPKKLSGGLKRRLNIAAGIAHKPRILILDEPTVAIDPQSRNSILEGIQTLNKQGTTIIYTSHYMEEVEQLCTRIAIMDYGRVIAQGTKKELKNMIKTNMTVTVYDVFLEEWQQRELKQIPSIFEVSCKEGILKVRCKKEKNNILSILNYLSKEEISFGSVISEQATLNDVFLEITGKELRD